MASHVLWQAVMRTVAALIATLSASWLLAPRVALAEPADELDGEPPIAAAEGMHTGVGVESTLAGVVGLSVRHGLGPVIGLEAVVMAGKGPSEYVPGGTFGSPTVVGVAVRVIAPIRRGERGVIAGVGGLDLGVRSTEMVPTAYHWGLEGGLRAEYFLVDNLSVSLELGAVIDVPPDSGRVLSPERAGSRPSPDSAAVSLDNTALAAGAGLTFWLK